MKAWVVETITEEGDLRLMDVPRPVPGPREYLLKVEAAGLNFADTLVVRGRYQAKPALPFSPGIEVVGRIEAPMPGTDEGGEGLSVGTRVVAPVNFGGFAEYAVCARATTVPIGDAPAGAAMALRGNYPTSLFALQNCAKLQHGETLLVHAGAGGVGSAAVELGKLMGARVIATAGGPEKAALCRGLGADEVIDYNAGDWVDAVKRLAPDGVDVVYDPVGGTVGEQSMRVLAWGARYLVIGFAAGTLTSLPANRLLLRNASAMGVFWGEFRRRSPELAAPLVQACFDWYRAGRLKPLESRGFGFEQAREALHALERRQTSGKALLTL